MRPATSGWAARVLLLDARDLADAHASSSRSTPTSDVRALEPYDRA